jgi:predicted metal-binding membrane protein
MMLERVLRHDRVVAVLALTVVTAAAWVVLLRMHEGMTPGTAMPGTAMPGMAMPGAHGWASLDVALLFLMWAVMMVAMMLPSAAPMIFLFASLNRSRRERASPAVPTAIFAGGYLLVWTGFSAAAALTQAALHQAALLSPSMAVTSPLLNGLLLVVAGIYQWLPLKSACLGHCRSPLHFLGREWREGRRGALVMGIRHGLFCLGCCWALMALLFVAGVMNLAWVAAIAVLVLAEKIVPNGAWIGRAGGALLAAAGVWLLAGRAL